MPFTITVCLAKIRCLNSKLPKVCRGFSASLLYIERKSAIEDATKLKRGIPIYLVPFTVTEPLAGIKYDVSFYFDFVFNDVRFF